MQRLNDETRIPSLKDVLVLIACMLCALSTRSSPLPPTTHTTEADAYTELAALSPHLGTPRDDFGRALAMHGCRILVGAPHTDVARREEPIVQQSAGAAYVFVRVQGNEWLQEAVLSAHDPALDARFGAAVALAPALAVVGAPFADADDAMKPTPLGAVFVYERNDYRWTFTARLTSPSVFSQDHFGAAVAVADAYIAVGAPLGMKPQLCIFAAKERAWVQIATLTPPTHESITSVLLFAATIAQSAEYIFAAARKSKVEEFANAGAVYVYQFANKEWKYHGLLTAKQASAGARFGSSLALSDRHALVGAANEEAITTVRGSGAVYVFQRDSLAGWNIQSILTANAPHPGDDFGRAVSLSNTKAVIGAQGFNLDGSSQAGAVYIFALKHKDIWTQKAVITSDNPSKGSRFGYSVALDGNILAISTHHLNPSAESADKIYLFAEEHEAKFVDDDTNFKIEVLPYNSARLTADPQNFFLLSVACFISYLTYSFF
eukprot:TRINITY_DN10117_c0_g1_i1.p1 TRINITY_DN10117_c0_g1~~TRINITY_DN10117_c0_g1_i1.p1  ORF type:complete len:492 (+),score=109.67 TRINITY_DN10117_c0_g1_i1:90-1565(+)